MYNEGISKVGDVLDIASNLEIVTKRGAFFSFGDTRLGQGRENAKEFLKRNPDLLAQIEAQIRANAVQTSEVLTLNGIADAEPSAEGEVEPKLVEELETEAVAQVA
jgi:recombination protein RecA